MKRNNYIALFIIFCLSVSVLTALQRIDIDNEYTVKPGDKFYIQITSLETKEFIAPVTLSGKVVIYPLAAPIEVGDKLLGEAIKLIKEEVGRSVKDAQIVVELASISPYTIHLLGAVNNPGEYLADSLLTLHQSLKLAKGLHPSASKKVQLTRRGEIKTYDLNRYLAEGDISQNPIIMSGDLITASFAKDFAKFYVVTDTTNYVEYFEIEKETSVKDLFPIIAKKNYYSDFKKIYIKRAGEIRQVDENATVKIGDTIYLHPEESYILVRGNVNFPGKYSFHGGKSAHYYISLAGGINRVGSNSRIIIVDKEGNRKKYKGQPLNEGDAVLVPVSFRTYVSDYLTPIGTIFSLITTIIVLTK